MTPGGETYDLGYKVDLARLVPLLANQKSAKQPYEPISTAAAVESLLKSKFLKKRKPSTIKTDDKRHGCIIKRLPFLTTFPDEPAKFLKQFDGETGRYLLDFYNRLNRTQSCWSDTLQTNS